MKRMNKVVSLTVATALLLSSMDMMGVRASEKITEDTGVTKEQPLQEFTEVPELQAVTASTPTVKVTPTVAPTNSKDFVIENGVLTEYKGKEKKVVIPDGVTTIKTWAFRGYEKLESITLPKSVTTIERRAFAGCSNLTEIGYTENLKNIGSGVFADTQWLKKQQKNNPMVVINGILIDGTACSGVVTIPSNVTKINTEAFLECKTLTGVKLHGNVTEIGEWAFAQCINLKRVYFVKGVKSIESGAFYECEQLSMEKLSLPNTLKRIGSEAFSGTAGNYITIPKSVTYIGAEAFYYCRSEDVNLSDALFIIRGYKNTTAHRYAKKYNIEFISANKKVDYSTKEIKKKYGQKAFSVKVSNQNATYTTSNKKVATVSKNGTVTIKGCGEVIINIKAPASESKNTLYKKVLMRVYPKKISNVSVYSKTKGKLTVKWKANSKNVECYEIEISTDKNFKRICDNVRVAGNKTSYTLSEKAGKTYYVRVQAIGSNGLDLLDCYTPGLDGGFSKVKKVKVK